MDALRPPPLPPFELLHPLVVHFPIGLLLVVPLFVLLGLLVRSWSRGVFLSAWLLMVLGTLAAFVAVRTGNAAEKLAIGSPAMERTLERHEELAKSTTALFMGLTLAFTIGLLIAWRLGPRLKGWMRVGACVAFLALHALGALRLANAGHEGGMLVHEHGVRASHKPLEVPMESDEFGDAGDGVRASGEVGGSTRTSGGGGAGTTGAVGGGAGTGGGGGTSAAGSGGDGGGAGAAPGSGRRTGAAGGTPVGPK